MLHLKKKNMWKANRNKTNSVALQLHEEFGEGWPYHILPSKSARETAAECTSPRQLSLLSNSHRIEYTGSWAAHTCWAAGQGVSCLPSGTPWHSAVCRLEGKASALSEFRHSQRLWSIHYSTLFYHLPWSKFKFEMGFFFLIVTYKICF